MSISALGVGGIVDSRPSRPNALRRARSRLPASRPAARRTTGFRLAFVLEIGLGVDGQLDVRQELPPRAASRTRRSRRRNICWNSSRRIRKLRSSAPSSLPSVRRHRPDLDCQVLGRAAQDLAREFLLVLDVLLALALLDAVERRLRDEDVPRLISSCMWRKKNVSSSVRMCEPSTSASVMMMILP